MLWELAGWMRLWTCLGTSSNREHLPCVYTLPAVCFSHTLLNAKTKTNQQIWRKSYATSTARQKKIESSMWNEAVLPVWVLFASLFSVVVFYRTLACFLSNHSHHLSFLCSFLVHNWSGSSVMFGLTCSCCYWMYQWVLSARSCSCKTQEATQLWCLSGFVGRPPASVWKQNRSFIRPSPNASQPDPSHRTCRLFRAWLRHYAFLSTAAGRT